MLVVQFAPVDTPMAVERFLLHWTPGAAIFMESELWPTLILKAALKGVRLYYAFNPIFQYQAIMMDTVESLHVSHLVTSFRKLTW